MLNRNLLIVLFVFLFVTQAYCVKPTRTSGDAIKTAGITVWANGDSVREDANASYEAKNYFWDGAKKIISLKGAKNEWLAFQIFIKCDRGRFKKTSVTLADFISENKEPAKFKTRLF